MQELLPGTIEWTHVCEVIGDLEGNALVVGITRIDAFGYDQHVFRAKQKELQGADDLSHEKLFYQPDNEQYHEIVTHGFPTTSPTVLRRSIRSSSSCAVLCDVVLGRVARVLSLEEQQGGDTDTPDTRELPDGTVVVSDAHQALPRFIVRVDWSAYRVDLSEHEFPVHSGVFSSACEPVFVSPGQSISAALSGLPPYSTVVLRGGRYTEQITLQGLCVRLVGDHGAPAVIASPAATTLQERQAQCSSTLRIRGGTVELAQLTVYANRYCLRPAEEQPFHPDPPGHEIPDLQAAHKKLQADVAARRSQDLPVVDQGIAGSGVDISEALHVLLEDCYVVGGLEVSKGSTVGVRRCSFVDGLINGAYLKNSRVVMHDCYICSHDSSNLAVENCSPLFLRCTVSHGLSTGAYVFNQAQAKFIECDIHSNQHTGIQVEGDGTTVEVVQCKIHHGDQYGMFLTDKAGGFVYNSYFYANGWAAATCTEYANPEFRACTLFSGLNYGFYAFDHGKGHFKSNWVHHNKEAAFAIASDGDPQVEYNHIFDNNSYGMYFFLTGMGLIRHNHIYCNRHSNICTTYASDPKVFQNFIYDCQTDGIYCMQEGIGLFEGNDIFRNMESNVMVQFDATPVFRDNKIRHAVKTGVCVFHKGKGLFENNTISDNTFSAVAIKTEGDPVVRNNVLENNGRFGVLNQFKGKGLVEKNTFRGNKLGTVRAWKDTDLTLKGNIFEASSTPPHLPPPDRAAPAPPGTAEQLEQVLNIEPRVDVAEMVM